MQSFYDFLIKRIWKTILWKFLHSLVFILHFSIFAKSNNAWEEKIMLNSKIQYFSSLQNFLMAGGAEQERGWEGGRLLQRVESTKKHT